ncbi:MAG: DUF368 domain-containing protein [Flavobacteriales bacterium]
MGIANKIPGVSGGAIAWAFGFFEPMISSFSQIGNARTLIKTGGFSSFFKQVNGAFLLILFFGAALANLTTSLLLDWLFLHYASFVWIFFAGLILATAYYLFQSIALKHQFWYLILGLSIGVLFTILNPMQESRALWFVFLSGAISVCGMTVPGLSGSFLLILLGMYQLTMVESINNIVIIGYQMISGEFIELTSTQIELLGVLVCFVLGSFLGLILFSKLIKSFMKTYENQSKATIGAFMLGSIGIIWPWRAQTELKTSSDTLLNQRFLPNLDVDLLYHVLLFALAWLCIYALENKTTRS